MKPAEGKIRFLFGGYFIYLTNWDLFFLITNGIKQSINYHTNSDNLFFLLMLCNISLLFLISFLRNKLDESFVFDVVLQFIKSIVTEFFKQ